ncbi:hypothetical protein Lesp02_54570 [Lentzea sp. NBRC 105346]|nr:hypothetical protein Lesp02_54570 [Lentzea sp. NBRC 105346]
MRAGEGDPEALIRAFRESTVYVQRIDPLSLPMVEMNGLKWIAAFSSLEKLAQHLKAQSEVDYLAVQGERLLDTYLPAFPGRTGIVFDTGSEHMIALPPVKGIVSDELAVDA